MSKLLVEIVVRLVAFLPPRLRVACGKGLGWLLGRVLGVKRRRVREHLRLAYPDLSEREIERLGHAVYRHLGLLLLELLALPVLRAKDIMTMCEVRGLERYETAAIRGKGVIILSAHLGNWELGLARAAMLGHPCHVLTREVKAEPGRTAVERLRRAQGNIIPLNKEGSIRQIIEVLRDGGSLGMVLDQNRTVSEGVFVDFFGQPACTSSAAAVLAERVGCAVVPLRFYRQPDQRHHVAEFLPEIPWEAPFDNRQDNLRHNTQRYTAFIEDAIREHPAQWIWMHRRWRTQPKTGESCIPNEPLPCAE